MRWDNRFPSDWWGVPDDPPGHAPGVDPLLLGVGVRALRVDLDDWL